MVILITVASSLCESGGESYINKQTQPRAFLSQEHEPHKGLKALMLLQLPRAESSSMFGRLTGSLSSGRRVHFWAEGL